MVLLEGKTFLWFVEMTSFHLAGVSRSSVTMFAVFKITPTFAGQSAEAKDTGHHDPFPHLGSVKWLQPLSDKLNQL